MVVLSLDAPIPEEIVARLAEAVGAHFIKAVHMAR